MPTSLKELTDAEAHNLEANTKNLGNSVELVNDFESVYEALKPLISLPKGGVESDEVMAVMAIIHELEFCQRQLTMSALTLLRAYQGDALLHLRRAIEAGAFAVRMSKHHELCRLWWEAAKSDGSYRAYRDGFRPNDLFPNAKHPDHELILSEVKLHYDQCSKVMHGSIFGVAGHFQHKDSTKLSPKLNFFDLPTNRSVFSVFYLIFDSHKKLLHLFEKIFEQYTRDRIAPWRVRLNAVEAKLAVHREHWRRFAPNPPSVE